MTKGGGSCKIDGVMVGELKLSMIHDPTGVPSLGVTYALVNSETKDRFGSGNRNVGWSDETMGRLRLLLESIEADVCKDLFTDGAPTAGGAVLETTTTDSIPSL